MRPVLVIALLVFALPALAQPDDAGAKAEQYFDAGRRAGDKGNLEDAISAFEAGLRYRVTAKLVIGKALAYEGLWQRDSKPVHLREALASFRRALKMADNVQAHAAEILGIGKSGLNQKIKRYNIEVGTKA